MPFESLLEFDTIIPANIAQSASLYYINPAYYSYSMISASTPESEDRSNYIVPFYNLSTNLTGVANNTFNFKDNRYKMAMHNFLSEIPNFFLKNKGLTSFVSSPQKDFKVAVSGVAYTLDIVLSKEENLNKDYSASGSRNHYGPGFCSYASTLPGNTVYIEGMIDSAVNSWTHGAYSPPYHYGESYMTLAFTPTDTRKYSLDEILSNLVVYSAGTPSATYSYVSASNIVNNILQKRSNFWKENYTISTMVNYYGLGLPANTEIMSLTSSLNYLQKSSERIVQFDQAGNPLNISDNPDNSLDRWVIQTKFECPVVSTTDTNDYWMAYGNIPSEKEKLRLEIKERSGIKTDIYSDSLIDLCGFNQEVKNIGTIAEEKNISEAIVMIPYTLEKNHVGDKSTARTILPLSGEFGFYGSDRKSADTQNKPSYFYVDTNKINSIIGLDIKSSKLTLEQLNNRLNDITVEQNNSIVKTMKNMFNYNLPPNLDWISNKNIDPFVMYIIEFNHILDKEDLLDMWQGLMPKISRIAEKDSVTLSHDLTENEFFHGKTLPKDIRWKVFKVKKRANTNYYKLTADSKDDQRFKFSFISGDRRPEYSYNWPYDYFSLVEMINIDASLKISDETPEPTRLIPQDKWWKVDEREAQKTAYYEELERRRIEEENRKRIEEEERKRREEDQRRLTDLRNKEKVEVTTVVDTSKPGYGTNVVSGVSGNALTGVGSGTTLSDRMNRTGNVGDVASTVLRKKTRKK